jgi:uncharacterized protein YndB with AHSA1/START domain
MNATRTASAVAKQVHRVVIQAPLEKVWAKLTETDVVLPFFFCSVMQTTKLAVGAPVRMRSPNGKHTGVVGEVVEFDPPRRFSHTFKFTAYDDPVCLVTYDLKPIEGGTEFTLTSERVPVGTKTEKQMNAGGKMIATALKTYVETGRPSFVSRMIGWVNVLASPFTPKKCLSTHWPLDKKIV